MPTSTKRNKLPNNARLRSEAFEEKLRRGGKPRPAVEKDDGVSRLGKPIIALFLFVVVGSAVFQILQTVFKAF